MNDWTATNPFWWQFLHIKNSCMQNHKWLPLRAAPLKIWMMRTEMFIWVILGVQEGSRHLNSQKGRYLAWKRQFFFFLCKLEEGLTSKKCVERGPSCVKRSIHQTWNPSLNSGQDTWLERQNSSCILDMACQSTWPTCRLFAPGSIALLFQPYLKNTWYPSFLTTPQVTSMFPAMF